MRYYYFHDGAQQSGPFQLADIELHSLKPDTAVWYAELDYWVWAKEVEELKDFIKRQEEPKIKQPPAFDKSQIKRAPESLFGKRQLKLIAFAILFIATFVGTLSFITNVTKKTGVKYTTVNHIAIKKTERYTKTVVSKTDKRETGVSITDKKRKEELSKEEVKERDLAKTAEKRDAAKFLVLNAVTKSNLWGSKVTITASITNIAKVTKYKDVLLEITYYNQRKTIIGTSKEVAYVEIDPGERVNINLKTAMPAGGRTADCKILTAIHFY
jgi:hypothetical protein